MKKIKKYLAILFSIVLCFSLLSMSSYLVAKASGTQKSTEVKSCHVRVFDYDEEGFPLSMIASIVSVNGKAVDNLKEGDFEPGTILEIERENGFFWFQQSDDSPGFAIGRFGDVEAKRTTYIVPNQENVGISLFWGGAVWDLPNGGMIRSVNSKIVAINNQELQEPVIETSSREQNGVLVTVVADEMKSTDKYDYEFVGWESDSGKIEFTNPQEKTTQFTSNFELGTVVFAIYKEIPKQLPQKGKISINLPSATKNVTVKGLEDATLTDAEKELLSAGKNINLSILIDKKENSSIDKKDLQLINSKLTGKMQLGEILDIRIEKQVEGEKATTVNKLSKPIQITIDVPEQLRKDNASRVFSIIHLHNGSVEVLKDLDNDNNTITFETSSFSLYGIAYEDTSNVASPQTGDNNITTYYIVLMMITIAVLCKTMKRKNI